MLLRGQNLLGYRHYADDVVEKFVAKSIENGVGIVRVFDALNDPRNLETSMKAIKKYGGRVRGGHQLYDQPRPHDGVLRSARQTAGKHGGGQYLHQRYGKPPASVHRVRPRVPPEKGARPQDEGASAHAQYGGYGGYGEPEGDRGGRRHRRLRAVASRQRHQPAGDRAVGRDARGHAV